MEEFKEFTDVYSCGRLSSLFGLNEVPASGLDNFVSIPMFYLCFKFLNAYFFLILDKPNSVWKFL